ncbi:MAG: ankyrin repeat domain-containing protein, partial [Akkermansia sp.]|nr:ankyrin repeat domain-containing protein [Akkermansia sp.]
IGVTLSGEAIPPEKQEFIQLFSAADSDLPPREEQQLIIEAWRAKAPELSMWQQLKADCIARCLIAPVAEQLVLIAADGQANRPAPESDIGAFILRRMHHYVNVGMTPAIAASLYGNYAALRALIRQGANPNAQVRTLYSSVPGDEEEADFAITPLLAGVSLNYIRTPWSERKPHAEYLLAHGANLNKSPHIALCCTADLALHQQPEPLLWAMENGLIPGIDTVCTIIHYPGTLPLLRYVLQNKLVDINDRSGKATAMQMLAGCIAHARTDEELSKLEVEEKLELLLQAGANPDIIPRMAEPRRPSESEDDYDERISYCPDFATATASELLQKHLSELKDTPETSSAERIRIVEDLLQRIRQADSPQH